MSELRVRLVWASLLAGPTLSAGKVCESAPGVARSGRRSHVSRVSGSEQRSVVSLDISFPPGPSAAATLSRPSSGGRDECALNSLGTSRSGSLGGVEVLP